MQLGRLEALNSVNVVYREKFLANFLKQELRRWKNADGNRRLKSANSSSKLSNKRCHLICIKDQTMPISIFQQVGESSPTRYSCQL